MNRQPTLAEILSDDTGRIRAEVADLLMEPHAQRRLPVRQAVPQRARRFFQGNGLAVAGAFLLLACIAVAGLSGPNPDRANNVAGVPNNAPREVAHKPVVAPVSIPIDEPVKPQAQDQVIEDDNRNQDEATEIKENVKPVETGSYFTGKSGNVIAASTPITTTPDSQGEIIRDAYERQSFPVFSFKGGWYKVALPNYVVGYIFGSDFISCDVETSPYRIAALRNVGSKLLVKGDVYDSYLQVIWRDGSSSRWISREDVLLDVYRCEK